MLIFLADFVISKNRTARNESMGGLLDRLAGVAKTPEKNAILCLFIALFFSFTLGTGVSITGGEKNVVDAL